MATLTTTHNFNFNENICKSVFKTEFDKEKDLTKNILKYVDNTIANNSMFFKQRYGNQTRLVQTRLDSSDYSVFRKPYFLCA